MTLKKIISFLESITSHVTFDYNGKGCCIDPISNDYFTLTYGKDFEVVCKNIEEVKTGKFFDGKSFEEIFDEIADTLDY